MKADVKKVEKLLLSVTVTILTWITSFACGMWFCWVLGGNPTLEWMFVVGSFVNFWSMAIASAVWKIVR